MCLGRLSNRLATIMTRKVILKCQKRRLRRKQRLMSLQLRLLFRGMLNSKEELKKGVLPSIVSRTYSLLREPESMELRNRKIN